MKGRLVVLALGASVAACGWIVGIGDHHLEQSAADDAGAGDGQTADAAPLEGGATDAASEGGAPPMPTVVATDQNGANLVAVDPDAIYWRANMPDDAGVAVVRIDKQGDAGPRPIVVRQDISDFALDTDYVYFTDGLSSSASEQGLRRVPKDGGAVELVDADGGLVMQSVAVGADAVLSAVRHVPGAGPAVRLSKKDGSDACFVYVGSAGIFDRFVLLGDVVYFWATAQGGGGVWRATAQCDAGAAMFLQTGATVWDLESDGQLVYAASGDGVFALSPDAAAWPPSLDTTDAQARYGVGGFGGEVYYSAIYTTTLTVNGHILRAPAAGGAPAVEVAPRQSGPHRIAIDTDGTLYWTNFNNATVMKLPPR